MVDFDSIPFSFDTSAVIEPAPALPGEGAGRCLIHHRGGTARAWTWLDLSERVDGICLYGTATLLPIDAENDEHVLVRFDQAEPSSSLSALPGSLCPIDGVVQQVGDLVASMLVRPLQVFVARALTRPEAVTRFWRCPASRRNHHAYPGGLAEHSLEVAVAVSSSQGLPELERELGVAFALLHDYGKLWCLEPELRNPCEHRHHEQIGREELQCEIHRLAQTDASLAALMDELLGGPAVPRSGRYPLAVKKVVHAFDQMSCEKTRWQFNPVRQAYGLDLPF